MTRNKDNLSFLVLWTAMFLLYFAIGFVWDYYFPTTFSSMDFFGNTANNYAFMFFNMSAKVFLSFLVLASLQSALIRKRFPSFKSGLWIVFTVIGQLVFSIVTTAVLVYTRFYTVYMVLIIIFPLVISILKSLVLQKVARKAILWVLLTLLHLLIYAIVNAFINVLSNDINIIVLSQITNFITGFIIAVLSGCLLLKLKPKDEPHYAQ